MLMNQKRIAALAVVMAFLGGAGSSITFATPVTFYFGGVITEVDDPMNVLMGRIEVGDPFSGSYTFDLSTPDLDPSPMFGLYDDAFTRMQLTVGDESFIHPTDSFSIISINDLEHGRDLYTAGAGVFLDQIALSFGIQLSDPDRLLLESDLLLAVPPELGEADFRRFGLSSSQLLEVDVDGVLDYLSVVPEPTTGLLCVVVLFAIVRHPRAGSPRRPIM